jgi:TolB-like protein
LPASIFLSYASEDREPARSIGDALAELGIDVWLDESALGGGDAWDQKIRRQIRECDYFMPIVSTHTEARPEGYFRREWRLAVERTLDMADDHLFLLPIVIDDTDQARARVPEKFLAVQWLRVPQGRPTPALEALCRRILTGAPEAQPAPAKTTPARPDPPGKTRGSMPPVYPPFPREEPGQRIRFWAHVVGWTARSAWISLQRLPRWMRILVYVWVAIVAVSRGCTPGSHERPEVSRADAGKLQAITDAYRGSTHPADIARLGAQIANEFSDGVNGEGTHDAVLAIPFGAPANDAAAAKLADAAFAQTYGRLSMTHRGQIALGQEALSSNEAPDALGRARARHSSYVVYGAVQSEGSEKVLSISVARVKDGAIVWKRSYPAATAEATKIGEEVDAQVPTAVADDD